MTDHPIAMRALRGHRPQRPRTHSLNSADHHAWLARHITPRDRWLLRMLFEHKVFTTNQIIDLAFLSRRSANLRLHNLHNWGLIHRFQPHRDSGTHPMHYVLDTTGATILAHEEGTDLRRLNYSRERAVGRAYSLQLAHDVACNSLFTALIRHARHPDTTGRLTAWWSASRCKRLWGDTVVPDGYGRWHQGGREVEWFLEFDTGTEQLSRLAAKLTRYARLATTTGIITPILFWLPTARREASVRRVLMETLQGLDRPDRVPTATAHTGLDSATPQWLRLDSNPTTGRVTYAELSTLWPNLPAPTPLDTAVAATADNARVTLAAPCPMPPPDTGHRAQQAA